MTLPPGFARLLTKPGPNRIENERHNNGDGRRHTLGHFGANRAVLDDYLHLFLYQVFDQPRDPTVITLGGAPFNDHIPSFRVTRLAQPLTEELRSLAIRREADEKKTDASRRYCRLRARHHRQGRRRTANQNADETPAASCPPPRLRRAS